MNNRYIGENLILLEQLYLTFIDDELLHNRGLVRRIYRILLQNVIAPSMHVASVNSFSKLISGLEVDRFKTFKGSGFKSTLGYSRMRKMLVIDSHL